MKTFKDLDFKPRHNIDEHKKMISIMKSSITEQEKKDPLQARMDFTNGYGISVIVGGFAYGSEEEPYECAVFKKGSLCYDTHITADTIGNCVEKAVTNIMKAIQELDNE
jgi:hypothetical protein